MRSSPVQRTPLVIGVLAAIGVAFIVIPIAALLIRAPWSDLAHELSTSGAWVALRLSIEVSLAAAGLSLLFGAPVAWVLARSSIPGRSVLRAIVILPLVLPPVVGGVGLLAALGRSGVVGRWLDAVGIQLTFTVWGAIVATTFVSIPLVILATEAGLRSLDPRLEGAAAAMGASRSYVLRRVTIPLLRPQLAAGLVLAWARALGEFGATITFAGNLAGRTQTLPLAVYQARQTDPGAAILLSLILVALSLSCSSRCAIGSSRDDALGRCPDRAGRAPDPRGLRGDGRRDHRAARPERFGQVDRGRVPGGAARPRRRVDLARWPDADRHEKPAIRPVRGATHRRRLPRFAPVPHLSAIENAAFPLRARGIDKTAARERARALLDRLGFPAARADARPKDLSGGEAQRVALARALIHEPRLLLMDEPTSSLDVRTRAEIRPLIRSILEGFAGVRVLVTHDPVEAMTLADRIVVLEDGRMTQRGTPDELRRAPRTPFVADLVGVNLFAGRLEPLEEAAGGGTIVTTDGAGRLVVPWPDDLPRQPVEGVLAVLRPADVVLHVSEPEGSARNVLHGSIAEISVEGERARVRLTSSPPIVAEVTRGSVQRLDLHEGGTAWASFKAVEVSLVLP